MVDLPLQAPSLGVPLLLDERALNAGDPKRRQPLRQRDPAPAGALGAVLLPHRYGHGDAATQLDALRTAATVLFGAEVAARRPEARWRTEPSGDVGG